MPLSRSENMARIRAADTSPELTLRKALWRLGLRYRVHYRTAAGKADLAFPGKKVAVFVDGCFWHGCPDHYVRPRTRADFWSRKLRENVNRDRKQTLLLEAAGWRVLRIWEHEVFESLATAVARIEHLVTAPGYEPVRQWRVVAVRPCPHDSDEEERTLERLRTGADSKTVCQRRSTKKWRTKTAKSLT